MIQYQTVVPSLLSASVASSRIKPQPPSLRVVVTLPRVAGPTRDVARRDRRRHDGRVRRPRVATSTPRRVDVDAFAPSPAGLRALDARLASRAALAGHALCARRRRERTLEVVDALNASPEALEHARRWAAHVSARGDAATRGRGDGEDARGRGGADVRETGGDGGRRTTASAERGREEEEGEGEEERRRRARRKAATASTKRVDVSTLDVFASARVTKAWEHPDAEKLWCENIDLGEKGTRQICSGLRAFKTKEQMEGARVCVIVNVKPGKLRDVKSDGLVLCASNADHTEVDFVIPPEGAAIGERVAFPGFEGEPEEVLNPKKKQLEAVCLDLKTNAEGVACYKDVPFTTSAGACTSSLKNCFIK